MPFEPVQRDGKKETSTPQEPDASAPDVSTARGKDSEDAPQISVVVPVHNEAENIAPLIAEITAALEGSVDFEILYIDDGSTDATSVILQELRRKEHRLRVLSHKESCGQSAAIRTGVEASRGAIVATLDGDGQNDPADIPALLKAYRSGRPGLVAGQRRKRNDSWLRRVSSRIANGIRGRLFGDNTPDTGCGLKLFPRAAFLRLPYFDHMHRFLPALMMRDGVPVRLVPVHHRPRLRGQSKYGVMNRLWVGIVDLAGVMWLMRRLKRPKVEPES